MSFTTTNSHFHLHVRSPDLHEFRFHSNRFPLEDTITNGKSSRRLKLNKTEVLPQAALMHESEKDVVWFKKHFVGRRHMTFLALKPPRGPMAISYIEDRRDRTFKFLVRTAEGSERHAIAFSKVPTLPLWRRVLKKKNNPLQIIHNTLPEIPTTTLHSCDDPFISNELLAIDERQVIRSFKFGVGYIPAGRNSESDMLSVEIEHTSQSFKRFLDWLGDEVQLKGWTGYRGGLDVKNDSTGTKAIYTPFHDNEIIYHVSPYLPSPTKSTQRTYVERKRHLGNDLVLILFQDRTGSKSFRLDTLGSRQNHVVCLVREAADGVDGYEVSIALREGVPPFGPELPSASTILKRDPDGREWLLYKLIQAERASYRAPVFASKISRTRGILLADVAQKFVRQRV